MFWKPVFWYFVHHLVWEDGKNEWLLLLPFLTKTRMKGAITREAKQGNQQKYDCSHDRTSFRYPYVIYRATEQICRNKPVIHLMELHVGENETTSSVSLHMSLINTIKRHRSEERIFSVPHLWIFIFHYKIRTNAVTKNYL